MHDKHVKLCYDILIYVMAHDQEKMPEPHFFNQSPETVQQAVQTLVESKGIAVNADGTAFFLSNGQKLIESYEKLKDSDLPDVYGLRGSKT